MTFDKLVALVICIALLAVSSCTAHYNYIRMELIKTITPIQLCIYEATSDLARTTCTMEQK